MEKFKVTIVSLLLLSCGLCVPKASAQTVEYTHDEEMYKQIRSMEAGKWEFSPALWYLAFHQDYSGARLRGFSVKFNASRSNTGQLMPTRVAETGLEYERLQELRKEEESLTAVMKDEMLAESERVVDLKYNEYKDEFNRIQKVITEALLYSAHLSKGDARKEVEELAEQNELLCEQIAYFHKAGVNHQLENTKRQLAYEDALTRMRTLKSRALNLALLVKSIYEK